MIRWKPFQYDGVSYSLDHLHPSHVVFEQPAKGAAPAREYKVRVGYSMHCFTRASDSIAPELGYSDSRETRAFDFGRYELSKRLPQIIADLPATRCFHTGYGNFFIVREVAESGAVTDYEIYFSANRSTTNPRTLEMFVQTAFVRDLRHQNRPRKKPIGLLVILFNRLNNKRIVVPR